MAYPKTHKSNNWENHMPVVVNSILKREYKLDAQLPKELINKVANTHLGVHMSNHNGKEISRDVIRDITKHLLERAKKIDKENREYELRSSHLWALKSYEYLNRRIEENIQEVYPKKPTHIDKIVIGEFDAVMLVPRVIQHKSLG